MTAAVGKTPSYIPQVQQVVAEEQKSAEMERAERAFAHNPPAPILLKRQLKLVDKSKFLTLAETFSLPFDTLCQLYWWCESKNCEYYIGAGRISIQDLCCAFCIFQSTVLFQMTKAEAQELFLLEKLGKVSRENAETIQKRCSGTKINPMEILFAFHIKKPGNFLSDFLSKRATDPQEDTEFAKAFLIFVNVYLSKDELRKISRINLVYRAENRAKVINKLPQNIIDFEGLCRALRYFPGLELDTIPQLQAKKVKEQFPDLFFENERFHSFWKGLKDKKKAERAYEEMGEMFFTVLDYFDSFQNCNNALEYLILINESGDANQLHACRSKYNLNLIQIEQIVEKGCAEKLKQYKVPFNEKLVNFDTYVACLKRANSIQEFHVLLNFDFNYPKFILAGEEVPRFSHIFPVRKKKWGDGVYGGEKTQRFYGMQMYKYAKAAADWLKKGKRELGPLLYLHAFHRLQVAESLRHNLAERYGRDVQVGSTEISTTLSSRYQALREKIVANRAGKWERTTRGESSSTEFITKYFDPSETWELLTKKIVVADGRELIHTEALIIPKNPENGSEKIKRFLSFPESGGPTVTIFHSNSNNLSAMMAMAEKCYKEAIEKAEEGPLYEKLGEFFWWICTAKPWELGDPSIAELVIRSILLSKDLPIYPWKDELVPWEEVVIADTPEEFGKRFSSLFDRS